MHVRHKEIVLKRCAKSHSKRNMGHCWELRSICLKVDKTSVEFTVLFQVKVKRQTDQLLDHKKNPLECRKKSLKRLDKWLKHLDTPLKRLGKTLEGQKNR